MRQRIAVHNAAMPMLIALLIAAFVGSLFAAGAHFHSLGRAVSRGAPMWVDAHHALSATVWAAVAICIPLAGQLGGLRNATVLRRVLAVVAALYAVDQVFAATVLGRGGPILFNVWHGAAAVVFAAGAYRLWMWKPVGGRQKLDD